jgi:hypothetical protein
MNELFYKKKIAELEKQIANSVPNHIYLRATDALLKKCEQNTKLLKILKHQSDFIMGMFDYIKCEYPLPGKAPYKEFQTKCLDCAMDSYLITSDGQLARRKYDHDKEVLETSEFSDYTGTINFYISNITCYGNAIHTANGEDAISVAYVATFLKGKLIEIKETEYEELPALAAWKFRGHYNYEENYIDIPDNLKRVYVLWGGEENGYYAEVVAVGDKKNRKQFCIKHETDSKWHSEGELELIEEYQWGRILFLNAKDALSRRDAEKDRREKQKEKEIEEYEAYKKQWLENKKLLD